MRSNPYRIETSTIDEKENGRDGDICDRVHVRVVLSLLEYLTLLTF